MLNTTIFNTDILVDIMTDSLQYDKPLTNGRGPWWLITRTNRVSLVALIRWETAEWKTWTLSGIRSRLEFHNLLLCRVLEKITMLQQPDTGIQWCDEPEHSAADYIISFCNFLSKRSTQNVILQKTQKQWKHCELCWKWEWDHNSAKCNTNLLSAAAKI